MKKQWSDIIKLMEQDIIQDLKLGIHSLNQLKKKYKVPAEYILNLIQINHITPECTLKHSITSYHNVHTKKQHRQNYEDYLKAENTKRSKKGLTKITNKPVKCEFTKAQKEKIKRFLARPYKNHKKGKALIKQEW